MNLWRPWIGSFEFARFNPLTHWFCLILFVYYIIYKAQKLVQWQGIVVATFLTWVRVPGLHYLNIIFPCTFTCSFSVKAHHTLTKSSLPRVWLGQSKGYSLKDTMNVSQCTLTLGWKVNEIRSLMGLKVLTSPPLWGLTPP